MNPDQSAEYVATVGSLFSGIGGIDLGLERAGFRVIWQAETDPYASKVLAKHWPGVPNLGDVTATDWSDVERPDVVCGGFPCQPVSLAGRRLAQRDPRWLWPAFAHCIRHLRPDHVVVENVPGLLVGGMGDVLGELASLGYDAEWTGLPAGALGAPHLRWRVFIVAHAHSSTGPWWRDAQSCLSPAPAGSGVRAESGRRCLSTAPRWEAWPTEPDVDRMAHGVPAGLERLSCLGNAVVPQVAEFVGRQLAAHIDGTMSDG